MCKSPNTQQQQFGAKHGGQHVVSAAIDTDMAAGVELLRQHASVEAPVDMSKQWYRLQNHTRKILHAFVGAAVVVAIRDCVLADLRIQTFCKQPGAQFQGRKQRCGSHAGLVQQESYGTADGHATAVMHVMSRRSADSTAKCARQQGHQDV